MEKFTRLTGVAAPFPSANVDTDQIIPAEFLKVTTRSGLGVHLFKSLRYDENGKERPDFVLNREPYRHAKILITGDNFGCGSSREHAPWALHDFGIRAIVAPSYADIFFNNSFKNGMLPIVLARPQVAKLMADAEAGAELTVDLEAQVIVRPNGEKLAFEVDSFHKRCLLNGLDGIGLTLQYESQITAFEQKQRQAQPWLWS
jgi:3-isopropylmalate/(R)-2-methylmalate dehydratase small subunit